MADLKITQLTENTTPLSTDILPMVKDPGGTPATDKVTIANLFAIGALQSKVLLITRDVSLAGADVAYTGAGFQPSSLILVGCFAGAPQISMGAVGSTKAGYSVARAYDANFYPDYVSSAIIVASTAAGAVQSAIVKSFDSDGFTLTWTKTGSPTGTFQIVILCLK